MPGNYKKYIQVQDPHDLKEHNKQLTETATLFHCIHILPVHSC